MVHVTRIRLNENGSIEQLDSPNFHIPIPSFTTTKWKPCHFVLVETVGRNK